ncbi:hypothetical protein E2C01_039711 [Portunus trituberculatus]|uniref:Uncharacterized protein n=1 Tax=Portunus trituberculatus TaxID=210409 RepID=A0A5B7FKR0_PORTR|nr:hypothetical protein [Portunus trituberculatus]
MCPVPVLKGLKWFDVLPSSWSGQGQASSVFVPAGSKRLGIEEEEEEEEEEEKEKEEMEKNDHTGFVPGRNRTQGASRCLLGKAQDNSRHCCPLDDGVKGAGAGFQHQHQQRQQVQVRYRRVKIAGVIVGRSGTEELDDNGLSGGGARAGPLRGAC